MNNDTGVPCKECTSHSMLVERSLHMADDLREIKDDVKMLRKEVKDLWYKMGGVAAAVSILLSIITGLERGGLI